MMLGVRSGLLITLTFAASAASAAGIEGTWLRGDGNARVRIASCGNKICATNLWIKDATSGEAVGDRLVMTLSGGQDGTFSGTAYDERRKWTYNLTIKASPGVLESRGCLVGKMVCREISWRAAR